MAASHGGYDRWQGISMHILAGGSPSPLPGFLGSLAGLLDHLGYWAVLLLVILEDFGIPVPGETVLIAASVYAGAGRLNVVAVSQPTEARQPHRDSWRSSRRRKSPR
jgi:hypothetical protein